MKIKRVIKLGIALLVLIQTVQVAIAQVNLTQIDQDLMSEIVICDDEHRVDACEYKHHHKKCCQNQVVDITHCSTSFQVGLAVEPSKSLIRAVELSHSYRFTETESYYSQPTLEHFRPPI